MNVGSLFIELGLNDSDFVGGMDAAIKKVEAFAKETGQKTQSAEKVTQKATDKIGNSIKNAFTVGAVIAATQKVGEFTLTCIDAASDVREVQNVVDTTFGDSARSVDSWAKKAKNAYGLSTLQAKQYASTMGAMLKSMGLTEEATVSMSTQLASLVGDMASFYNLDHDIAFEKIRSGIAGETEPLKQLGINMSVANLEAYRLAKGIDTAFSAMSQGQQAQLRFEYIMQATADAQGDFAKTADSYANSTRTLANDWEDLKAELGTMLLPAAETAVSVMRGSLEELNKLIEGQQTAEDKLRQTVKDLQEAHKQEIDGINASVIEANDILDAMEEMTEEGITPEDTDEWQVWLSYCNRLVDIMPSLADKVNTVTGEIDGTIASLRIETAEWEKTAIAAAEASRIKAWEAANEEATESWAKKEMLARDARRELDSMLSELSEEQRRAYDSYLENGLAATAQVGGTDLVFNVDDAAENAYRQKQKLDMLVQEADSLHKVLEESRAAFAKAQAEAEEYLQVDEVTAAYEAYTTSLASVSTEMEKYTDLQEQIQKNNLETVKSTFELFEDVRELGDEYEDLFREMSREDAGKATESMAAGLESQALALVQYAEDLRTLKSGIGGVSLDPLLLAKLSDGTEDSMLAVRRLAQSSPDDISRVNIAYGDLATAQEEASAAMTEAQLAVDTNAQSIIDTVATMVEECNQHGSAFTNAAETSQGVADGLKSNLPVINGQVNLINAALSRVGADVSLGGLQLPGFATGIDYVPYDMPAIIHQGEAVLTKAENAGRIRGGASGGSIDLSAMTNAIVAAVRDGMRDARVNAYLNGRDVTEEVSRGIAKKAYAARYST